MIANKPRNLRDTVDYTSGQRHLHETAHKTAPAVTTTEGMLVINMCTTGPTHTEMWRTKHTKTAGVSTETLQRAPHLGPCIHLEDVPDPPAPQGALVPPQHVMAGLVGKEDGPAVHGGVAQQHSLLLVPDGPQQRRLRVLLQQDLLVALYAPHHHLSQLRQQRQLLCR